jgi:histidine phosphotransfer protein HptB
MDAHRREDEIRARLADISGPQPSEPERALLGRLIRNFQAKTPGGVDQLGALLRSGSAGQVREQAHGLKGSASNLGAGTLAAIFAEVEHAARDGVVPDPDRTLARLGAELMQVHAVLEYLAAEFDQAAGSDQ